MKAIRIFFSWSILLTVTMLLTFTACQKDRDDDPTINPSDQSMLKAGYKLPSVRTIQVTENTTGHSVKTGITVSQGKGNPPVTECGIIWSPTTVAKLGDEGSFHRVLGFTEGTFTTIIDTLTINQPYFFRGYAINSNGIAYDTYDVVSVTNIPVTGVLCPNTMTDLRNGKSYSVVLIGDQCWMAENLNVGEMVPGGTNMDNIQGSIQKYCYNNSEANCAEYGAMYPWDEVMQTEDPSVDNPSGVQGICPDGWHLPSFSEISQLTNEIGGSDAGGGKLKETGTQHWLKKNAGTDEYGFTSLGSGEYSPFSNEFRNLKVTTYYWSTTTYDYPRDDIDRAWTIHHDYLTGAQFHFYMPLDMSFTVRCVKDYSTP